MRICIIGGSGHIGGALVPMLAGDGYDVSVVASFRSPVPWDCSISNVTSVMGKYVRGSAAWAALIGETNADIYIDILGIDLPATYAAVRNHCGHFIACGSLWMYGPPKKVPTPEETQGPCEFGGYAGRYEEILNTREQASKDGIPFTAIMPTNICGPGKVPIDCRGGRVIANHKAHMRGETVYLPEKCETYIGPCDVTDIARCFALSVENVDSSAGQMFNAGAEYALTAPHFVETYADIYNTVIPVLEVPAEKFYAEILPERSANYHFREHMYPDISKAKAVLGYKPQYTPEEAMERAVQWMRDNNLL